MNQLDILLDMLIGSVNDESTKRHLQRCRANHEDLSWKSDYYAKTTNAVINNIFCKLFRNVNISRNDSSKNNIISEKAIKVTKPYKKINSFKNTLKYYYKKNINGKLSKGDSNLFQIYNDLTKSTFENENRESYEKLPEKSLNEDINEDSNSEKLDTKETDDNEQSLDLFFQSLSKSLNEFSEAELIEFKINVLKVIKTIKDKKELKQNLKRYYVASLCNLNNSFP